MITWSISSLDRRTSDGFVQTAHWQCSGVDGEHSASVYATCSWSEGQPAVPYASLTEAAVLAWVWESVDKDATEAAVQTQLDNLINPPVVSPALPW